MAVSDMKFFEDRISELESRVFESTKSIVRSELKKKWKILPQSEQYYGLFIALCVNTLDPLLKNRVQFYHPVFHDPNQPIEELPWAQPVSAMGGFDDSGLSWPPPAGSTIAIMFEAGSRRVPFYLGTIWQTNRGPANNRNFGYPMTSRGIPGEPDTVTSEYYQYHDPFRGENFFIGPNDGAQVMPPWNSESYNAQDTPFLFGPSILTNLATNSSQTEVQENQTIPNIYGFKTPQKHMMKMVDGNYDCNYKGKRIEIMSSGGNWMMFKDDPFHSCNSIPNSGNGSGGGSPASSAVDCTGESVACEGENGGPTSADINSDAGNPFFKNRNELRPFSGPGTPLNNRCELNQTGIQFLSRSGHSFFMDDSVEQPGDTQTGWRQATEPFTFGCTDVFNGKTRWISATGHFIEMSDVESSSQLRGEDNFIRMRSALGSFIELNDHTEGPGGDEPCPPNIAGSRRGISMGSTSQHLFQMIDEGNEQCEVIGGKRTNASVPTNEADKAFILLRSGYGSQLTMRDQSRQDQADSQYLQLFVPQDEDNPRGNHIMQMTARETAAGVPGQIYLRAGGDLIVQTYDQHVTVVGDLSENPSDKITQVSRHSVNQSEGFYVNQADGHYFVAEQAIALLAGNDCPPPEDNQEAGCQPCGFPVCVLTPRGIVASSRLFGSAKQDDFVAVSSLHIAVNVPGIPLSFPQSPEENCEPDAFVPTTTTQT